MPWQIEFHEALLPEVDVLQREVQKVLAAHLQLLAEFGPELGRPTVDTLKGSRIANLKELRFSAEGGVWRLAFAFDRRRVAVLLAIGNKRGGAYWRAETEPMAPHRITFENNTVRDNEGWGLFLDGATRGTILRGNVIEDTGSGRQKTGLRIGKQAGDVQLEGNTIKAQTQVLDERPAR